MTLIGVEWLQEMAMTFFFLVFKIWGPPKIILPRAPQSVRPGLSTGEDKSTLWVTKLLNTHTDTNYLYMTHTYTHKLFMHDTSTVR